MFYANKNIMITMKRNIAEILGTWLPIAAVITVFVAYGYLSQQHILRSTANDLPLQIVEDSAESLAKGMDPESAAPQVKSDLAKSLGAFILILDDEQKELVSSMQLDNQTPIPPKEALDYAKEKGQNTVTWQPKNDVRVAIVIKYYNAEAKGYVIAGQSLREVEKRIDVLATQSVIAYTAAMTLSLGLLTAYKLTWNKLTRETVPTAPKVLENIPVEAETPIKTSKKVKKKAA
jgi:hypothetical protein